MRFYKFPLMIGIIYTSVMATTSLINAEYWNFFFYMVAAGLMMIIISWEQFMLSMRLIEMRMFGKPLDKEFWEKGELKK